MADNTERKRRQGQKKADGKTATPKQICPKCGEYLQTCYIRKSSEAGSRFLEAGLICPSSTCDYIIKNIVEIEDTEETEPIEEIEND